MTEDVGTDNSELVLVTASAESTRELGSALARAAMPLPDDGLLVAFHGDLGAGKTVFVQGVAAGLGVPPEPPVVSPTFTIARSYPAAAENGPTLHHVDAYRLHGGEDLENVGFEEMRGSGCLTCVEWSARVEDALPADRIEVWIEPLPPPTPPPAGEVPIAPRRIRLVAEGRTGRRILARLARACGRPVHEGSA